MRTGFYPKLAWTGIYKNRQVYFPYLLTCIGMVMMYYIISYLSVLESLDTMSGGDIMGQILGLGCGVLAVFALIFLFYTNSFLIRRRKKEFGLYNILGMGKKNLVRIQIWESIMIAVIALCMGIICGIAVSKLVELVVVNVIHANISFAFSIPAAAVASTLKVFAIIFLLIFISSILQIHVANPIELLRSENAGEKRPKANWLLAVLGIVLLGVAYYVAVTIKDPVEALLWFFVAVIMVIGATYLLFIAGSVVICYLLQKNKRYYYKTRHFVSVSSMMYRMKRNGAGLASICILSTMVLVMVSSTTCLYIGIEDSLDQRYVRDMMIEFRSRDETEFSRLQKSVDQALARKGQTPDNRMVYHSAAFMGFCKEGHMVTDVSESPSYDIFCYVQIVPLEDYNNLMQKNEKLNSGECIVHAVNGQYDEDFIDIEGYGKLSVKKQVDDFIANKDAMVTASVSLFIFTPDYSKLTEKLGKLTYNSSGNQIVSDRIYYNFDLSCPDAKQIRLYKDMWEILSQFKASTSVVSKAGGREEFYGLYGGLFIFGILLGIVFLAAMVLIMYYKQMSEGFEDQGRFSIMQKVGMTKGEIRQSINSQILTVFFLPLIAAGVHLCFSFPLVSKMLSLFASRNTRLLIAVTMCCYLAFALFYVIVYYITSRSYYKLVSNGSGE